MGVSSGSHFGGITQVGSVKKTISVSQSNFLVYTRTMRNELWWNLYCSCAESLVAVDVVAMNVLLLLRFLLI